MKRIIATAAFAVMLPLAATAQESDPERAAALEQCLLDASGAEEEALVRELLITLLEGNVEEIEDVADQFYMALAEIAISQCGAPEDIATQRWAAEVPGNYLSIMVQAVFAAAIGRLGGP